MTPFICAKKQLDHAFEVFAGHRTMIPITAANLQHKDFTRKESRCCNGQVKTQTWLKCPVAGPEDSSAQMNTLKNELNQHYKKMTWENDEVSCQVYALYCAILQIVILIWYQVNRWPLLPIPMPILMLLTYKGSICSGEQCVMIYEINHHQLHMLNTF